MIWGFGGEVQTGHLNLEFINNYKLSQLHPLNVTDNIGKTEMVLTSMSYRQIKKIKCLLVKQQASNSTLYKPVLMYLCIKKGVVYLERITQKRSVFKGQKYFNQKRERSKRFFRKRKKPEMVLKMKQQILLLFLLSFPSLSLPLSSNLTHRILPFFS